jgi:hypothetical protein
MRKVNYMAKIHPGGFDVEAWEKTRKAGLSKRQAEEVLLMAAQIIRAGRPLPMGMAEWLAGAIESAISSPHRHAPDNGDPGHALLVGLGLLNNNRRKVCDWLDVGELVDRLIDDGKNKTSAVKAAAAQLGIGYGTAFDAYSKYCEAKGANQHISRD